MIRATRVDRLTLAWQRADAVGDIAPGQGRASKTPEGYLDVDAYLARDGLLRYSDGTHSWLEYRPRSELEAAARTWALQPVTDEHPPVMVSAANASEYARGFVVDTPRVVVVDGVAYLRARLRITDADLIRKIEGGQTQLSIGFEADVYPERGVHNGARYDAIQRMLAGNHVASVPEGRAGPIVGVLFDNAPIAVHAECSERIVQTQTKAKRDESGSPVESVDITGPEGTIVNVASWLASAYEFAVANGWGGLGTAKPEAPAAPKTPETPPGDEAPDGVEDPDKDKDKIMTPDAIDKLVSKARADGAADAQRYAALVRKCDRAGLSDAEIESCGDYQSLARLFVARTTPHAKTVADKADGAALDALVEVAASAPKPVANPFEVARKIDADDKPDEIVDAAIAYMTRGTR